MAVLFSSQRTYYRDTWDISFCLHTYAQFLCVYLCTVQTMNNVFNYEIFKTLAKLTWSLWSEMSCARNIYNKWETHVWCKYQIFFVIDILINETYFKYLRQIRTFSKTVINWYNIKYKWLVSIIARCPHLTIVSIHSSTVGNLSILLPFYWLE